MVNETNNVNTRKKGNFKCICGVCGKEFFTYHCYALDGRGKYCSKECGYSTLRKHKKGERTFYKCKISFPLNENYFYKNKSKKTGFMDDCIKCRKIEQSKRNKKLMDKRKEFIESKHFKCNKCGIQNFNTSFFDIDHIEPVKITRVKRQLPVKYDDKIFQVICPNCHRLKTINE